MIYDLPNLLYVFTDRVSALSVPQSAWRSLCSWTGLATTSVSLCSWSAEPCVDHGHTQRLLDCMLSSCHSFLRKISPTAIWYY